MKLNQRSCRKLGKASVIRVWPSITSFDCSKHRSKLKAAVVHDCESTKLRSSGTKRRMSWIIRRRHSSLISLLPYPAGLMASDGAMTRVELDLRTYVASHSLQSAHAREPNSSDVPATIHLLTPFHHLHELCSPPIPSELLATLQGDPIPSIILHQSARSHEDPKYPHVGGHRQQLRLHRLRRQHQESRGH